MLIGIIYKEKGVKRTAIYNTKTYTHSIVLFQQEHPYAEFIELKVLEEGNINYKFTKCKRYRNE